MNFGVLCFQFRQPRPRRVHGEYGDGSAGALQGPVLRHVLRADVDAAVEQELLFFAATTVPGHDRERDDVRQYWGLVAAAHDEGVSEGVPLQAEGARQDVRRA